MTNPLYFIEAAFKRGAGFIETDRDTNSRDYVIGLIRSGEVSPIKVLLIDEEMGTVEDVTAEILEAAHVVPEDYRNVLTGEDRAAWERDRRRAIEMAE